MKEIILALINSSPGIGNILFTAVLLPVIILLVTNRHQKNMKEVEVNLDLDKERLLSLYSHEDKTYGALTKILFDIQMLHVELSKPKCEKTCIINGLGGFKTELIKNQSEISESQLKLAPVLIDELYKFYKIVSDLIIELSVIEDSNSHNHGKACVSNHAQELSECLLNYKRIVLKNREQEMTETMPNFRNCCGHNVSKTEIEEYSNFIKSKLLSE